MKFKLGQRFEFWVECYLDITDRMQLFFVFLTTYFQKCYDQLSPRKAKCKNYHVHVNSVFITITFFFFSFIVDNIKIYLSTKIL